MSVNNHTPHGTAQLPHHSQRVPDSLPSRCPFHTAVFRGPSKEFEMILFSSLFFTLTHTRSHSFWNHKPEAHSTFTRTNTHEPTHAHALTQLLAPQTISSLPFHTFTRTRPRPRPRPRKTRWRTSSQLLELNSGPVRETGWGWGRRQVEELLREG